MSNEEVDLNRRSLISIARDQAQFFDSEEINGVGNLLRALADELERDISRNAGDLMFMVNRDGEMYRAGFEDGVKRWRSEWRKIYPGAVLPETQTITHSCPICDLVHLPKSNGLGASDD